MNAGQWVAEALFISATLALLIWLAIRSSMRSQWRLLLGSLLAGAVLSLPVTLAQWMFQDWAQIDPSSGAGGAASLLLYALLVVAPLKMTMAVAAVAPFWRLRRIRMRAGISRQLETQEGVSFAAFAAMGFVSTQNIIYLSQHNSGWLGVMRTALATPTFMLLCAFWGFVLGRHARRGMRGGRFTGAWLTATVFTGVTEQMIFYRGQGSMLALTPVLFCMLLVAWLLWRDIQAKSGGERSTRFSILSVAPAPSLRAIQHAFQRQDRPITLRWISFGALVTTGMVTAGVTAAVILGHEIGLDFSAVDRAETTRAAMAPLALLGFGAMAGFPSSGYLLARASGTRSVLEPAMAGALAVILVMVFMGVVEPTSVVFAIAFAPIALGLSCLGAWLGLKPS